MTIVTHARDLGKRVAGCARDSHVLTDIHFHFHLECWHMLCVTTRNSRTCKEKREKMIFSLFRSGKNYQLFHNVDHCVSESKVGYRFLASFSPYHFRTSQKKKWNRIPLQLTTSSFPLTEFAFFFPFGFGVVESEYDRCRRYISLVMQHTRKIYTPRWFLFSATAADGEK